MTIVGTAKFSGWGVKFNRIQLALQNDIGNIFSSLTFCPREQKLKNGQRTPNFEVTPSPTKQHNLGLYEFPWHLYPSNRLATVQPCVQPTKHDGATFTSLAIRPLGHSAVALFECGVTIIIADGRSCLHRISRLLLAEGWRRSVLLLRWNCIRRTRMIPAVVCRWWCLE